MYDSLHSSATSRIGVFKANVFRANQDPTSTTHHHQPVATNKNGLSDQDKSPIYISWIALAIHEKEKKDENIIKIKKPDRLLRKMLCPPSFFADHETRREKKKKKKGRFQTDAPPSLRLVDLAVGRYTARRD